MKPLRSQHHRLLAPLSVLLVLLVLSGCSSARRGEPAQRLVLVSYDGTGADLARSWIDDGSAADPDGLAAMADRGYSATCLRPVNPTLTAVSHVSLATGARPAETGIVSNAFCPAGAPITEIASGFSAPIDRPTLWQLVHRQGKRVGIALWPGGHEDGVYPGAELGISWPEWPLAASRVLELEPDQATVTTELPSHDQVQALRWQVSITTAGAEPGEMLLQLIARDSNDDGKARYDQVAARLDGGPWATSGERQWFALELMARARDEQQQYRYGAWCKVLGLDRHRGRLRLLQGGFYRLLAYPEQVRERLDEVAGFWPGPPDSYLLGDWWLDLEQGIDLDTFIEQLVRLDRYLDRVTEVILAEQDLDLLLAYHPGPDEYQHACLLVDPQQWAYSPGSALAAREGMKQIGSSVDSSVATIWRALDPERDALVVVSDHGLLPIHDVVYVNQVLADAGLVQTEGDGDHARIAASSPMRAVTSGGCAHLYLNREGQRPGGVVDTAAADELLGRAAKALADLTDEQGNPVVEQILSRRQAAAIGLDHRNSGDLVAFLKPGYTTSSALSSAQLEATSYYGQHGYLNHYDKLCGMLFARGAGVARARQKEVASTNLVTLIGAWMDLDLTGQGAAQ